MSYERPWREINHEKIQAYLNNIGADWDWKMIPASASHMGGVWERQIRTARSILVSLMKTHGLSLDDESLCTLMIETEAIINSRPLTTDNACDPESIKPISPMNLLTMKSKVVLPPPGVFDDASLYSRRRWRRVQHIAEEFWCRWRKEFLTTLQNRQKWNARHRNIQVDDIVILKDPVDVHRNHWPLARVTDTFPDENGVVRTVKIVTGSPKSEYVRPIAKLVLLLEGTIPDEEP